jgi:hypothetical protein
MVHFITPRKPWTFFTLLPVIDNIFRGPRDRNGFRPSRILAAARADIANASAGGTACHVRDWPPVSNLRVFRNIAENSQVFKGM